MLSRAVEYRCVCLMPGLAVPEGLPPAQWWEHPVPGSSETTHPPSLLRVHWRPQPSVQPQPFNIAASVFPQSLAEGTLLWGR